MGEADKTAGIPAGSPAAPDVPSEGLDGVHAGADEAAAKAEADLAKQRAQSARLAEDLDKLEKEAFPERPEPVHVDQAIGT